MKKKPLISIIVPVYNTEKYLEKCIESVLNQSFQDYEIILINDGSTDRSESICKQFAARDPRIILLSQSNKGLSEARNAGLRIVRGTYITGIDSDDWVKPDYLQTLFDIITEYGADIAVSNYFEDHQEEIVAFDSNDGTVSIYNSEEALTLLFINRDIRDHFWGKLYRKELFDDIIFPVGRYYEDIFIMYKLFTKCHCIVKINHLTYGYVQRSNSILGSIRNIEKKTKDNIDALTNQYLYILAHQDIFLKIKAIKKGMLRRLAHCKRDILLDISPEAPYYTKLLHYIDKPLSLALHEVPLFDKWIFKYLHYWLLLHFPKLFIPRSRSRSRS